MFKRLHAVAGLGRHRCAVALLCLCLSAAGPVARAASSVHLRWSIDTVQGADAGSTQAILAIANTGTEPLAAQGWALYFTCLSGIQTGEQADHVLVDQVVGSLYRLRPAADFVALAPGQGRELHITHPDQDVNQAKAPQGPYLVFDSNPGVASPVDYSIDMRTEIRGAVNAGQIYERNARIVAVDPASVPPVFPSPRHYARGSGALHWHVMPAFEAAADLQGERASVAALLSPFLADARPGDAANQPPVRLQIATLAGQDSPEAYELRVDPHEGLRLTAASHAGMARALASLRQLLPLQAQPAQGLEIPALDISDAPRFAFRGLMLDVARNFQAKATVLQLLELMARNKLNVFHFHLTDDEGWRLEIPGMPELTAIGARRGHVSGHQRDRLPPAYGSGADVADVSGSGYYRRADYIEILRYAAARHIEVIPEIEMPGHARAAVVAMAAGQYRLDDPDDHSVYRSAQEYHDNVMNPALPSTYAFIGRVVAAVAAMHREAGVPLRTLHVGGDELPAGAWLQSPACQRLMRREHLGSRADLWDYFYSKVAGILRAQGLHAAGWEELGTRAPAAAGSAAGANPKFLRSGFTLFVWNNVAGSEDLGYRLANAGYDTVLAPATRLYVDMATYPSVAEPGQNWAAYVDLDTAFNYIPYDDVRAAADDPTPVAGKQPLTAAGRAHIRGVEGALFSETIRGRERLDYMLMPRLFALAERAWASDPDWAREPHPLEAARLHTAAWSLFLQQLGLQVLPRLSADFPQIHYRIPPPGLKRIGELLYANEQLPGMTLRYTTDGSDPVADSTEYRAAIAAGGAVKVAAFDHSGRASRASQSTIQ